MTAKYVREFEGSYTCMKYVDTIALLEKMPILPIYQIR